MDFVLNRAVLIAVGVLVTIAIATGVMIAINQVVNIYGYVNRTDISIKNRFNEFTMYNNTVKTGADLMNTAKKYLGVAKVRVKYNDVVINTEGTISNIDTQLTDTYISGPDFEYQWKYDVKYIPDSQDPDGISTIIFTKK